jgi:hypothetical protein
MHLDNTQDLASQLSDQQLSKFDVVLMRQGLCYCHDPSFDCQPPRKLHVAGLQGNGLYNGPSSGTYFLEPDFRNGRPSYRRGGFLLHWRPEGPSRECGSGDWIVVGDDDERFIWANVVHDRGSPALAQNPWYVWDGNSYLVDEGVSCEVAGPVPWKRPPHACECCGGISLNAGAIQSFMGRVAAMLDERQPNAFALLQGGLYQGTRGEVEELQSELQRAVNRYNWLNNGIRATVLRRQEKGDGTTSGFSCISGLLLSRSIA